MPRGLEISPSETNDFERVSAPPSADFCSSEGRSRNGKKTKRKRKMPILRGKHQKAVPTLESGLVDMSKLRMYLPRNPLYAPLYSTRGWKYHHELHPESSFEQLDLDQEERDRSLIQIRRSSYQQVHMRVSSEMVYHLVHKIEVPHPPAEAVEMALRDFEKLDMLGAACLYLSLAKGHSQYGIDPVALRPPWMEEIALRDRLNFISEVRDEYAIASIKPEIIPGSLVTSALQRLSVHLRDPFIARMADERLASDPEFYPVRLPSHKTLQDKANRLVASEFQARNEPLQTGVDEVRLEAA